MLKEKIGEVTEMVSDMMGNGYKVEVRSITKSNGMVLDAITILKHGNNVSPAIYLNNYYGDSEAIAAGIVREYKEKMQMLGTGRMDSINKGYILDKVNYQMIGLEANKDYLKRCPHRVLLDMAVIYRVVIDHNEDSDTSFVLNDSNMKSMGITFEELDAAAMKHITEASLVFENLNHMAATLLASKKKKTAEDCIVEEGKAYVVTKYDFSYGAGLLMHKRLFEKMAERAGTDLLVLPSSIHDLIVLRDDESLETKDLRDMVTKINCNVVSSQESVLTNNVYRYVKETGEFEIA
ncbi:MAG: DUF5688 family protein [Lachnospiraceae bacterium]|nr:DUF5688 family protein [Lachnospiraceae bacterium]